jgi:AbrB family looped-hinge helix DNA binding protein
LALLRSGGKITILLSSYQTDPGVTLASEKLTTVVSTKGQVILPKAIRDRRHWSAGTRLTVEDTAEGVILKPAPLFAPTTIDEVFGALRHDGPPLSPEEMDAAVAAEAKRRARD